MQTELIIDGLRKDKFDTHYIFWGTINGVMFTSDSIHTLRDLSKKLGMSQAKLKKLIR